MKKKQLTSVALKVDHVSKSFHLPLEKASGLKQAFINRMRGVKGYTEQKVLKDISFEIKKGEFFGIVGRNGSGKSTLLKLISQIYTPNKGKITVNGSLVPFIELGVGFNPELTGRENVYLNGAMLGFSRPEIDAMYDEIVEFAELHDFMDQKLKNYSSGMQVRLAFSVAIKAEGDILVLDEVLAVGDEAFQRKCFQYFAKLKKDKKTVILVTHSMDSVRQFCSKAMMIESGRIVEFGSTAKVSQAYRELFMEDQVKEQKKDDNKISNNKNFQARVNYENKGKTLKFDISLLSRIDIDDAVATFLITRDSGEVIYRWTSDEKLRDRICIKNAKEASLMVEIDNVLPNGIFFVEVGVKSRDRTVTYALFSDAKKFEIVNRGSYSNDIFWKPKEIVKLEV